MSSIMGTIGCPRHAVQHVHVNQSWPSAHPCDREALEWFELNKLSASRSVTVVRGIGLLLGAIAEEGPAIVAGCLIGAAAADTHHKPQDLSTA